jgi:wyosine [tRNA(Phe)-imidazoG37] synthetase (radical SAM superfamily)
MYKYLFGPVPSRRLGISLGIDLVPRKVCTLDCVYCEVGKTTKRTLERKNYFKPEKIISELADYFANHPDPDTITFSGSGEPTLNLSLKEIITYIKSTKPQLPLAMLTNGTMLNNPEVQDALMAVDIVLPSLDAATAEAFQKINRPHPELTIDTYIKGLIDFRQRFTGKFWLEIFILPGYNDSESDLEALYKALLEIKPDRIQLNTLDRPGTLPNLKSASRQSLQAILDRWNLPGAEIIAAAPDRKSMTAYRDDIESAILETIRRRPCTLQDLCAILGIHVNELNKYLAVLEADEKIESNTQQRGAFFQIKH